MSFTRLLEDGQNSGESEHGNTEAEQRSVLLQSLIIQHFQVNEGSALETELRIFFKRKSINEILALGSQILKLEFVNQVPSIIFTGEKIICEDSAPLGLKLVDAVTRQVVRSGPGATARVEIVALVGNFNKTDWTDEEFESKIQTEMRGRKTILMNNVLNLEEGIGFLSDLSFTHNAFAVRNCELRLGAKVVGDFNGLIVKEAKTEPFTLKDARTKRRRKHESLSLYDEVWRMKGIGINGSFLKRLTDANIKTVLDFLIQLYTHPQRLKQMHNGADKMWAVIVGHARECKIDKKVYVYPYPSTKISPENTCVAFNVVGQVLGLLVQNQYLSVNAISETQKVDAQKLVMSAFEHSQDVVHFADENELINHAQLCADNEPWNNPNWLSPNSLQEVSDFLMETCNDVTTLKTCSIRISLNAVYFVIRLLKINKRIPAINTDTHISKKIRCC